jgi:TPR repeat protein
MKKYIAFLTTVLVFISCNSFSKEQVTIDKVIQAAKSGNSQAQALLGSLYYTGNGVEQNFNKSFEWLKRAAEQGDVTAQNDLGMMYLNGKGTDVDVSKSVEWYTKAAEQGDVLAQSNIGRLYFKGKVIDKDYKKALKWLKLAAEQNNYDAQILLGEMYYKGYGIDSRDLIKSYKWFTIAIHNNDKFMDKASRKVVTNLMSDEEIATGENLAQEWITNYKK